jgi:hypothetical protein
MPPAGEGDATSAFAAVAPVGELHLAGLGPPADGAPACWPRLRLRRSGSSSPLAWRGLLAVVASPVVETSSSMTPVVVGVGWHRIERGVNHRGRVRTPVFWDEGISDLKHIFLLPGNIPCDFQPNMETKLNRQVSSDFGK